MKSTFATGLSNTVGLAFDSSGNLYVGDGGANDIVEITPGGTKSIFASGLNIPQGLAFDSNGNLYEVDRGSNSIDKITPGGVVSTFATGFDSPKFLVTPEPSTWALMIVGTIFLSLIISYQRRKLASQASFSGA